MDICLANQRCEQLSPIRFRWVPWCSGYHVCLTRRRSRVRASLEPNSSFSFPHSLSHQIYFPITKADRDANRQQCQTDFVSGWLLQGYVRSSMRAAHGQPRKRE